MSEHEIYLEDLFADQIWVAHDSRKRPFAPNTGQAAKSNDRSTWSKYTNARALLSQRADLTGTGVQLGPVPSLKDVSLCGIDLDSCFVPEKREFAPPAMQFHS